jgi:hypothetical protein
MVTAIVPDEAGTISPESLAVLAQQVHSNSPELIEQVKARSQRFSPSAPAYLFVQEIVTYCCVVYSTMEVIGKVDKAADLLLDHDVQVAIVDRAIRKLRLIGLEYPAKKIEEVRDKVVEYWTRPDK